MTGNRTAGRQIHPLALAITLVVVIVFALIGGAGAMYILLSHQQRSWISFAAAGQSWLQEQAPSHSAAIDPICGESSLPDGFVVVDVGEMNDRQARQIFETLVIEFNFTEESSESTFDGYAGSGKWESYRIEGAVTHSGRSSYELSLSFEPFLCLST
ncbi:MAG: hypothetical protein QM650_07625 [Microlunatus sp.]